MAELEKLGIFQSLEAGTFGLIQEQKDGTIKQIGLSQSQSEALQLFLASLSHEKEFIKMPSDYDLVFKNVDNG